MMAIIIHTNIPNDVNRKLRPCMCTSSLLNRSILLITDSLGFEPRYSVLETERLPLTYEPMTYHLSNRWVVSFLRAFLRTARLALSTRLRKNDRFLNDQWRLMESNHGRPPLQGGALPAELNRQMYLLNVAKLI